MPHLRFTVADEPDLELDLAATTLVVAGWTGRDAVARDAHIAELAALGIRPPATTPIFYRVAAARLTQADTIEATGEASSGEVEFVLIRHRGRLFVGVGSDHTDRAVETYGITVSKQMCDKPVAVALWAFADVAPHWDRLVLRSWITEGGASVLYQEGAVAGMLAPEHLLALYGGAEDTLVMLCGTFPARGGIRPAAAFEFAIEDPVRGRAIGGRYAIKTLPVADEIETSAAT